MSNNKAPAGRDYAVTDIETGKIRIINARNPGAARAHAAKSVYQVRIATAADGIELARSGGEIEFAGEAEQGELSLADPPAHPTGHQPFPSAHET